MNEYVQKSCSPTVICWCIFIFQQTFQLNKRSVNNVNTCKITKETEILTCHRSCISESAMDRAVSCIYVTRVSHSDLTRVIAVQYSKRVNVCLQFTTRSITGAGAPSRDNLPKIPSHCSRFATLDSCFLN